MCKWGLGGFQILDSLNLISTNIESRIDSEPKTKLTFIKNILITRHLELKPNMTPEQYHIGFLWHARINKYQGFGWNKNPKKKELAHGYVSQGVCNIQK